jgi:hypothetical protein
MEFGVRICTLASFFGSSKIPALDTESVVRCTIPGLDLGPGKYRLSFGVADSSGQWLDIVEMALGLPLNGQMDSGTGSYITGRTARL